MADQLTTDLNEDSSSHEAAGCLVSCGITRQSD